MSTQAPVPPAAQPEVAPRDFSKEKTLLLGEAAQLNLIASFLPTPGVVDSHMNAKHLNEIANRLRAIAEGL